MLEVTGVLNSLANPNKDILGPEGAWEEENSAAIILLDIGPDAGKAII